MGIFDFIKNIGKKANEADMANELQKAVEGMGLGIKGLHVAFDHGIATIRGEAASPKDLELARLVVGNHEGVAKVNDDNLKVAPQAQAQAPVQTQAAAQASEASTVSAPANMYVVKEGDTLSKIAKKTLGDAKKYPLLFEANRPMIKDPNEIYPGQVIRIPKAG